MRKDKDCHVNIISEERWLDYFSGVLRRYMEPEYPPNYEDVGPLDIIITEEEINEATYILKDHKACGVDLISNEMLKCIHEVKPGIFIHLINSMLKGKIMEETTSMLVPIYKKGCKTDPKIIGDITYKFY